MKRALLLVGVWLTVVCATMDAQSPLVLDSASQIVHPNTVNVYGFAFPDFQLQLGDNVYYDFGAALQLSSTDQPFTTNSFFQSTNVNFPNALYYKDGFININQNYGFYADGYMRQTGTGFYEVGMNKDVTDRFGLGAMSGNEADSLIVPAQVIAYSTPRTILPYPCTMGTSWTTNYRSVANANITVNAFGLHNVPLTVVTNWWIKDSVVAWGEATVPIVGNQSSKAYPILVSQRSSVRQDSLYLGGQPAPDAFVTAFGGSQGELTKTYRYWSFRADEPNYLFVFNYASDSTYTATPSFFVSDRVDIANGVNDEPSTIASSANPNPATNDVRLHFQKPNDAPWSLEIYSTLGERVHTQMISAGYGDVDCPVSVAGFNSGAYMAVVRDQNQRVVSKSSFVVSH